MQGFVSGFKILTSGEARLTFELPMSEVEEAVKVAKTAGQQILLDITVKEVAQ